MIRTALLILVSSSFLRVCGRNPQPPQVAPVGAASGVAAMMPEHGGSVAVSGGLVAEVNAQPDGRLIAYVRDGQNQPVTAQQVQLSVRRPDGQLIPVAATWDPQVSGYVARPVGVAPGAYPIEVGVVVAPNAPPVQLLTPPVTIATRVTAPSPRHGGRVEIIGNHAVETVVARNGDVAMFWMDLNGVPIPPAQVAVPSVTVTAGSRFETVPVRVDGDRFVGHIAVAAPSPSMVIGVPQVVVQGVTYQRVVYPRPVIVAALPRPVIIAAPPPAVVVGVPAPPAVVVAPPIAPSVYIAPPVPPAVVIAPPAPPAVVVGGVAPGMVVAGHVPHGEAHGYWRNHGAVMVGAPAPAVVVAPPGPPAVVVGGGVSVGGGWGGGWGHGGGEGHGHGRH